ncbi:MAG: hypothetical protein QF903_06180 [Planctomycetota bacterium]|jgi:hypothetical protein|nr:hypothetical protein [Planctomycetota bacterium]MDP6763838.1 hypothetical protein [Planctomycetota bacterium]MDP6989048.1 hypothetical protein [Planctomycetota bacterium]
MMILGVVVVSAAASVAQEPAAAPSPFERVAVIGASASAGFGLSSELEASVRLGEVLACLLPEEAAVSDHGTAAFFRDPGAYGERLVTSAIAERPTLVVGVDFLFWYAFGARPDSTRPALFERGLAELERLDCPLLIGDLPDVSHALTGKGPFGGPLISRGHLPPEAMLTSFNQRLRAWAAERDNVTVAPLAAYTALVRDGEDIELRGNRWAPAKLEDLLQEDRLHPTVEGSAAILVLFFDTLVAAHADLESAGVRWKLEGILERLLAATEQERAERREKARRREERRREREERRREREGGDGDGPALRLAS